MDWLDTAYQLAYTAVCSSLAFTTVTDLAWMAHSISRHQYRKVKYMFEPVSVSFCS